MTTQRDYHAEAQEARRLFEQYHAKLIIHGHQCHDQLNAISKHIDWLDTITDHLDHGTTLEDALYAAGEEQPV